MSVPARLRLCASSPICSICPRIEVTLIGSDPRVAAASAGPNTSDIHRKRSSTSEEYAPYRNTFPSPSFKLQ